MQIISTYIFTYINNFSFIYEYMYTVFRFTTYNINVNDALHRSKNMVPHHTNPDLNFNQG